MPADPRTEIARMAECWLIVFAVAAPLGLVAWVLAHRNGTPLVARYRGWHVPWSGGDVFVAFLLFVVGMEVLRGVAVSVLEAAGVFNTLYGPADAPRTHASKHVMQMWGYLVAVPVFLAAAYFVKLARYPTHSQIQRPHAAMLALAVCCWTAFSLATYSVHFSVQAVFFGLGWPIAEHPLAQSESYRTILDRCLLVIQACVAAPLIEEVMFRGVLLPWLLIRRSNVWPVLGVGLTLTILLALQSHGLEGLVRGPVLFSVSLGLGWVTLHSVLRRKRHTIGAIYASAAIFALVHSGVWPSPIPLFILGLGLGWLAVRTRGVFAPAIVHGLFNAVSVIFVLSDF